MDQQKTTTLAYARPMHHETDDYQQVGILPQGGTKLVNLRQCCLNIGCLNCTAHIDDDPQPMDEMWIEVGLFDPLTGYRRRCLCFGALTRVGRDVHSGAPLYAVGPRHGPARFILSSAGQLFDVAAGC